MLLLQYKVSIPIKVSILEMHNKKCLVHQIAILFITVNKYFRSNPVNHFLRGKKAAPSGYNHFLRGGRAGVNHFLRGRKAGVNHFLRGRKSTVNHFLRGKKSLPADVSIHFNFALFVL